MSEKKPRLAASEITDMRVPLVIGIGISTSGLMDERRLHLAYRAYTAAWGGERAAQLYPQLVNRLYDEGYIPQPGPASTLLRKMLALHGQAGIKINVRIMSRNHAGIRKLIDRMIDMHGWMRQGRVPLIKDGIYSSGEPLAVQSVKAHGVDMLLGTNADDVTRVLAAGLAAAKITHLPHGKLPPPFDKNEPLTIGFDFDRVIGLARHPEDIGKDAEDYFQEVCAEHGFEKGLGLYREHIARESERNADVAQFSSLLKKMHEAQQRLGKAKIRLRIVTARDTVRQIDETLRALNIPADVQIECMGGREKAGAIADCDVFFDDIPKNIKGARLGAEVPAEAARRLRRNANITGCGAGSLA